MNGFLFFLNAEIRKIMEVKSASTLNNENNYFFYFLFFFFDSHPTAPDMAL